MTQLEGEKRKVAALIDENIKCREAQVEIEEQRVEVNALSADQHFRANADLLKND